MYGYVFDATCVYICMEMYIYIFIRMIQRKHKRRRNVYICMEMYIYISDLYICVLVYVCVTCVSYMVVGCSNGGGGGNLNFSKAKQLVAKWIGTRKRLFSERTKERK